MIFAPATRPQQGVDDADHLVDPLEDAIRREVAELSAEIKSIGGIMRLPSTNLYIAPKCTGP